MTLIVKLTRTALPLLVVALALGACDAVDPTEPIATPAEPIVTAAEPVVAANVAPVAASMFRGGIPFGVFHLPKEEYGATFNGSLGNISPTLLIGYLETARRSGTKVILTFAGSEANFKNADHTFSLTKWKERVNRYRGLNLTSYINDGTIVGHYMVDEPHDPENWGGKPMPLSAIEAMAQYSKQLWPNLPTIARAYPSYLKGYNFKYLDAAWAQYSERKGPVAGFLQQNVREAKAAGLALVVGLNQIAGGSSKGLTGYYTGKYAMSAAELESYGRALLAEPYACAFISWQYNAKYLARSDVRAAMASLSAKARNRSTRSCSASGRVVEPSEPRPPVVTPPAPVTSPPVPPVVDPIQTDRGPVAPASIQLRVTGSSESGKHYMRLSWTGATGTMVDVYRNGALRKLTENDSWYTNVRNFRGAASYVYKVCERGTTRCSASVRVDVR